MSYHPFSPANYPDLAPQPAFIPAATQAGHLAGSGSSWHSRSWSNIHCHRAGPAGSTHSWPAPAGRCSPCLGPWTVRLALGGPPSPRCCDSQPGSHGRHCMCKSPRPWAASCGSTVCHLGTGAHGDRRPVLAGHSWRGENIGRDTP